MTKTTGDSDSSDGSDSDDVGASILILPGVIWKDTSIFDLSHEQLLRLVNWGFDFKWDVAQTAQSGGLRVIRGKKGKIKATSAKKRAVKETGGEPMNKRTKCNA